MKLKIRIGKFAFELNLVAVVAIPLVSLLAKLVLS